ncbi:MAG: double zinc ribbon domain-containing protein [Litoreibacter sp.]
MKLQTALGLLYPTQCLTCDTMVEEHMALCGTCWRDTPFISGLTCSSCGTKLPGEDHGTQELCDDCLTTERPWSQGRAALHYKDNARKIILALKHGDRTEYAKPAGQWVANLWPEIDKNTLVIPVPLHWLRYVRRRYNQSGLIAQFVARNLDLSFHPDALRRHRVTESMDGKSRTDRFENVAKSIVPHPKYGQALRGARVLLVDDVMTSGATLAACTEACVKGGADHVDVAVLARVAKEV